MTSKPLWTPGPWLVDGELKVVNELGATARDIYSQSPDVDLGDTGICLVAIGSADWADLRREANALLIASAPELAEVLADLIDAVRFDVDKIRRLERAEAALAKARGDA